MKKNLFLFVAVATCVACSMDETTEVDQGLPIDFRTAVGTRATPIETSTLDAFKVWAFYSEDNGEYFADETFTKGAGDYFRSTTDHYWPTDNSELTFVAYAPTDIVFSETKIVGETNTITYTPSETISEQKDFITAVNTGSKADQETGVEMTFKHRLSQIDVWADYSGDKYTIKVAGVKIASVLPSGTYTFETSAEADGIWTASGKKVSYTAECDETELSSEVVSVMGDDGQAMLIPQEIKAWTSKSESDNSSEGAYLEVKIQIKDKEGAAIYPAAIEGGSEEYAWAAVPIPDITWEQHHKYTYTLHFTDTSAGVLPPGDGGGEEILGDPIMFTVVEVTNWEPQTPDIPIEPTE